MSEHIYHEIIDKYSLDSTMASCLNFAEELRELEAVAEELGVTIIATIAPC